MSTRVKYNEQLNEIKQDIVKMGEMVLNEFSLALSALERFDINQAEAVFEADEQVNQIRYVIDQKCVTIIGTQQPMAHDLRVLVSAMSLTVDLERMGDHAKNIAKAIVHAPQNNNSWHIPPELKEMGRLAKHMLEQCIQAYQQENITLAQQIADVDDEVDKLFARLYTHIIQYQADTDSVDQVNEAYQTLRVAQAIERFGDWATNIAERVVYIATGEFEELNMNGH